MKKRKGLLREGQQKLTKLDGAKIYANLREQVIKDGVLDRDYFYYAFLTFLIPAGFFTSIYFLYVTPVSLALIGWGLVFAFFTVQISGLLHDAGHRAIFTSTTLNNIYGQVCGFLIALGFSSWRSKHNAHHAHTNQEGGDPDVELPILSFTKERFNSKKGLPKLMVRYQAYLYFPLGVLVIFSPRIGSMKYLAKTFSSKTWWETAIFAGAFFAWFFLPFLVFDLQKALILFFLVNLTGGFYLLNVFAPNHKGMPLIDKGVQFSFLEQQIITSRNIRPNWLVDFVYMGLNYQIEHHLFPNTPRNKLKQITPYVLAICRKMKLEYTTINAWEQNVIILSELNRIGKEETR